MVNAIAVRKVAVMKIAVTKITHCKKIFEDLFMVTVYLQNDNFSRNRIFTSK